MRDPGILLALVLCMGVAACSSEDDPGVDDRSTGTLEFYANGEEFIREPFVAKDGWEVAFDHFFVNLFGPTAIQGAEGGAHTASVQTSAGGARIQHAGHPHTGITTGTVHAALVGDYLVDLHQNPLTGLDPDEERTLVGSVSHVDGLGNRVFTGNYNTVNFNIKPVQISGGSYTGTCPAMEDASACEAAALAMQGYSLRMTGRATCVEDSLCTLDEVVGFDIRLLPVLPGETALRSGIAWSSCTWEGEPLNPGLVVPDGTGWVEMTFHADHIFGDIEEPASDPINVFALGFTPFRSIAGDTGCDPGEAFCITADQAGLLAAWETGAALQPELQYAYPMLIHAVAGMGHCGEGHCLH